MSTKCLICESDTLPTGEMLPGIHIRTCHTCKLVFAENLGEGTNETAPDTATIITDPAFTANALRLHDARCAQAQKLIDLRIKGYEQLLGRPLKRVLEVGCGDGAWARAFLSRGIEYEALEIVPSLVSFCQSRGLPVHLCELQKWKPSEQYDVVFASQVVEHVVTPVSFVCNASNCLNPGGIVHLDVPNHSGLVSLIYKILKRGHRYGAIEPPHHLIGYSSTSMKELLQAGGLKAVAVAGLRNDDPRFGQLLLKVSVLNRVIYAISGLCKCGSLLTGFGQKRISTT